MPGIVFILAGLYVIIAAVANWDWFMNNYRAAIFVKLFGRDGARIFYGIVGGALVVLGCWVLFFGVPVQSPPTH